MALPCRPAAFSFRNGFCLSIPGTDPTKFILSQNELNNLEDDSIFISAVLNKKCQFSLGDVEILWNESFPAMDFPQMSSMPNLFGADLVSFTNDRNWPIINAEVLLWKDRRFKRENDYEKDFNSIKLILSYERE